MVILCLRKKHFLPLTLMEKYYASRTRFMV